MGAEQSHDPREVEEMKRYTFRHAQWDMKKRTMMKERIPYWYEEWQREVAAGQLQLMDERPPGPPSPLPAMKRRLQATQGEQPPSQQPNPAAVASSSSSSGVSRGLTDVA
jgi:hypothetical protein